MSHSNEELTKAEYKIVDANLPEGKKAIQEHVKKEEKTYWAQEFVWGTRCPRCDHVSTRLATRRELETGAKGERIGTTCQCGLYYEEDIQVINPQPRKY